ncbi:ATP-binding protein [Flavobacterium sp.]|uniref:sensor histidine kinase n=1 Tax=Flavobacterium sp. TaxID=239 RepID=UPI002626AE19|nr:HAMP domain-containing sensor histidine kinase [Flavobacterium sp.]
MLDESKRIEILNQYNILDTDPEEEFDNITFLASTLCDTPISTITIVDNYRQWFKSKIGLKSNESSRESSFCSVAIGKSSETTIIEKLMENEDFRKVGLLNGLKEEGFYAGVPLKDKESGAILGTLCVIDYVNKTLSDKQIKSLEILAEQTTKLFELRKKFKSLSDNNEHLFFKYSELENFASVVSHDIKSPLNNIISLIGLMKENSEIAFKDKDIDYLNLIEECSLQLKVYIDGILDFYKIDALDFSSKEEIVIYELIEELKTMLSVDPKVAIYFSSEFKSIKISKYALMQLLINLVSNGIKYNDKEDIIVKIDFSTDQDHYIIKVSDNGIGINPENFNNMYESFKNLNVKDRYGNYGTGLGLSTVKKIVNRMRGKIEVVSELKIGTEFKILLKK